ncbi:hypothetical protein CFC21_082543 [Triticum aestivum]|uniref:Premnaspirodiene oxygenase n=3 Tax=Triticum TaxID=4564 RepID=A0A9R1AXA4_TRITD|nr:premnaspirodiene oxygenase-like [Triticum dicoccoides]XP_044406207.1 premnaspirodiene oxygenase-like [Triticum aestivum]KAF7078062.1 hypothetical protein CFC21_082543 [Triticum aestivum]VAI43644.1 unnamed protein product [Triticum turgidum subsp. durum]
MADLLYQSIILSVVAVVLLQVLKLRVRPRARTPPGPWRLPVIGSMHHLLNVLPHRALRDLAAVHGPLMMLQLGQTPLVVVSSREMAREVLRTHDASFATRPKLLVGEVVLYSYTDILFSPSGTYWRKLRQLCAAEILSPSRVLSFRHIREQEVKNQVEDIHGVGPSTPVDATAIFSGLAISIISRASFGNKQRNAREFLSAVKTGVTLASGFKIPDLFPAWRSVLARATGMRRALEDVHGTIDSSLDEVIAERKCVRQDKARSGGAPAAVEENLVDVLIGLQEKGGPLHRLSTNSIKGVIVDMFVAGTGTISSSLDWGMAELMRSPRVMGKLQRELREAFPGRTAISERDIDAGSLPYLKLVIKENLRLHPPAPLLVPRESIHACELGGYVIPAGSRVIVNAWAIGRDPRYWGDDAEEFKPERFADSSVDFTGSSYEFLPFGAGRRMCPGVSYSLPFLQMALVQLCYHFDWSLPEGVAVVDMTEADGLGLRRKSPLRLCATPFVPESAC